MKPPVLWIRGDADQIVSDTSVFDLAFLGSVGAVPGWPGDGVFPPQPMVTQTRSVLDRYAATGGAYREVVLPDVGHSPHVERPHEFTVALLEHLDVPAVGPGEPPETRSETSADRVVGAEASPGFRRRTGRVSVSSRAVRR